MRGNYIDSADLLSLRDYCRREPEDKLLEKLREKLNQFDMKGAAVCAGDLSHCTRMRIKVRVEEITGK